MTTTVVVIATLLIILVTLIPTYVLSKKKQTSESDWAIADRSLPIYVVIGTQFASAMGGGVLVAHVGNAFKNGVGHTLYGILAVLPFFCIIFLAKWLRRNNYTTIPEILRTFTNGNKFVTIIAAFFTLIVPFGWVTSQITAFGNIYSSLTGIDYRVLCLAFAVISLLFVMPSGLKTVAWTDFIFSCFMCVICLICIFHVTALGGGVGNIVKNLNTQSTSYLSFGESLRDNIGIQTAILWIFAILPGGMTNQIYYQRVCAIDDEKKVNKSLVYSAIATILSFVWAVWMGLSIRSINPDAGASPTAWYMTQLPMWLMGLFAALIFATMMSTASSGCQTAVMNITRDIIPLISPNMDEKKLLRVSRILSLALIVIAILMCLVFTDTLTWLTATYAFSAAALACPIFVGYAMRKKNFVTTPGIIAGMIGGILGCALGMILKTKVAYAAVGMGVSLISMLVVCALTKNKGSLALED